MSDALQAPSPTLAGMTFWTVGRCDPEPITDEHPGAYSVEICFDDPDSVRAWRDWLMANDPAWRDH